MADRIILKRSLTEGSVPTTSSLEIGELAMNVADGKAYLRRSGSVGDIVVPFVTANTITTGSIQATAGFTGSLFGTASFASTASYLNTLNQDLTFNGNLTLNGTASITYLDVTYESASVIYSSGSNQFGDASNDVQTLWGTVDIKTGPVLVTGSVIATSGFTGSLLGTASYASQALSSSYAVSSSHTVLADTASGILGGSINHVPYFITNTTLATSSIYQSGSSTVVINQDNATSANPEALFVWQPSTSSINVISGKGNLNNYLQLNIQNTNQGVDASSDVVATADNGSEVDNYIDMGINSENYTGFLGGPNDAYLYAHSNDLWFGNLNDGHQVYFFNSSSLLPIITLNADNAEVTGSLYGTASWAQNALNADNATSASYALTASFALNVPVTASYAISSSYAITSSHALNALTASYAISSSHANNADSALTATSASHALIADNALTANYATTAGNGGVTQLIAGSGITLLPPSGLGNVTIVSTGGGGVTIISGSLVTSSFTNTTSFTFNHNLNTRTPIITVFDSNYNQIIPENIQLVDTASAIITFPTQESGFAIGSTGGTTGTALSSSYALFATYADTASYFVETDPIFVAKSASLATTGSNIFKGNQTITGSLLVTQSYISKVDYIEFTSASDQPVAPARLGWNDSDGTLNLGLKGGNVDLLVGEVEVAYVYNAETSSLSKGTVVFITGSQGNRISVKRAFATSDATSAGTLGFVAEPIIAGGTGFVVTSGVIGKLDTSNYPEGALVYLSSSAGEYTTVKPQAPIHEVRLGYVQRVHPSVGSIYVKVDNGYEIEELHDILVISASSGDLLVRSGSLWINTKQLTGSYALTGSLTISGSSTFTNIGTTLLTGSLNVTGSTTQTGNNTLIGNTVLSGSINISGSQTFVGTHILSGSFEVSGSSNFHNSEFIVTGSTSILGDLNVRGTSVFSNTTFTVTGSQYFTGSSFINGNQSLTGNSTVTGSLNVIGDINVVSGSSFTRWGNKLFNYGQFANTASISATANVSASFTLPLTYFNDGVNIVSGSRITFTNTGLYNIQYSALAQQGNSTPSLNIWFKKTGSNVDNSNTIIQLQNNSQTAVTSQFAQSINAGEYIELWYHSNGSNTSFPYTAAGGGFPASPSVIVTVTQIA